MSTITTLVTPAVTIAPVEATVTSAKKLSPAERTVASAFAHWASVTDQANEATLLVAIHLIASDKVSVRRASDLATEVLGDARGWTKDRISAIRWTAPVWQLIASPAHEADDFPTEDGERLTVLDLLRRVSTLANRLTQKSVIEAIGSVDEPSVCAYVQALEDALTGKNTPPASQVDPETETDPTDPPVDPKSGWSLDGALATAIATARKRGLSDADILASFALAVTTLNTEGE